MRATEMRSFNGVLYRYDVGQYPHRRDASQEAKRLRGLGWRVRVMPDKWGWALYTRRA